MKKKLFIIAAAAMLLGMTACQKEQITPNNPSTPGNDVTNVMVSSTSDLIGTNWTSALNLSDLLYAMTGMNLSDFGCDTVIGFDSALVFHIEFDSNYAHLTFSENMEVTNVTEVAGEYTIEEIEQMNFAYVYDPATHTGTLTAVGVDENNNPINYQIAFTYSDNDDTITINLLFANAEDEDTTISFPLVFHRDI
ncbi:MAG: hypothetical protein IK126_08240 [Bacteroidales bacterium]|nr:hypothetical protein [Bacteroidales bacterium]